MVDETRLDETGEDKMSIRRTGIRRTGTNPNKPSLYAAARYVALSMSISLVDRWHAMCNAIFDEIKR